MYAAGGSFNNPGFAKLPKDVQAKIKARSFADGGPMAQLTEFNEGGRHEENPIGGIPQGFAPDGQPNLVEQGETKLNSEDYIYSDTIKVTKDIALDFSLPKNYIGKTFAQVSKEANRPKSRRENDTIEEIAIKRDLDNLMQAQEEFKKRDLEKDMQMMMEKHPQEMQQLMAGAQGMPQEGMMPGQEMAPPQEIAPEEQVPQSAQMEMPQGQPMDPSQMSPEMLAQMEGAQQGMPVMRMGGNIYMCGGKMYDFGGNMYAHGGHMYPYGGQPLLGGATTGTNSYGLDNPYATNNTNPLYDMMHQYDVNPTAANPMMDLNAPLNTTPTIATQGMGSDLAGTVGSGIGLATTLGQGAMNVANISKQDELSNKQKAEQYAQTGLDAGIGVANMFLPGISAVYGIQKGLGNFASKIGDKGEETVTSADGTMSATRNNKETGQVVGDVLSGMLNPTQSFAQGVGYLADKNFKQAALMMVPGGIAINKSIDRKEENKRADEIERMNEGPQFSTLGMAVDDTNSNPYSIYSKKYGGMQYAMGGAPEFGNPAAAAMLNKNPGRSTFGADYNIAAKPTGGPGGGALANRPDSLAVSNNARAVHDFYRGEGYVRNKVGIGKQGNMYELQNLGSNPWKTLEQAKQNMQDRTAGKKTIRPNPIGITRRETPIITGYNSPKYTNINQYYKANPNNPYQSEQREVNTGVMHTGAPMNLFDTRIEPQTWSNYSHPSSGDNVLMPQYDPIAVAPIDTLSDKDLLYRLKNFGTSGFNDSTLKRLGYPTTSGSKTQSPNNGRPQQPVVEPVEYDKDGVPIVAPPRDPFATPDVANKPIPTIDEMMAGSGKEPMVNVNAEQFSFRPVQEHMYNAEGQKLGLRAVDTDEVRRRFAMGENNPAFSPYGSFDNTGETMNPARGFYTQTDAEENKFYVGTDGKALTQRNDMLGKSELIAGANPTNPQYIDQRYEGDPYAGAATLESQKYFGAGDYPALPETPGFVPSTNQRPDLSNLNPAERAPIVNQMLQNNMQQYNNQMDVTKAYQGQYPIIQPKPAVRKMGGFLDSDFSMYGNDEAHSYAYGDTLNFEGDPVKGETRVTTDGYTEMYNGTDWEIVNPESTEVNDNDKEGEYQYKSDFQSKDEKLKDRNLDLEMNQSLPEFLSGAAPAAYNLGQGIFGKVSKLNPDDYRVQENMKPYQYNIEPQLRSADRTFAQGQDAVRNAGLSGGNYASNMQQLANSRNQEISDLYAQKQNQDAASYNQAMAQNKAIEAENLQRRMGIEDYNRQSAAAKTAMLQAGMQQLAQISESSQGKKMQLALMKAIAPDFAGTLSYNNIMDQYLNKVKDKKKTKTTKG
jgi:hypothetical protein